MTEQVVESGLETTESKAPPAPQISEPSAAKPTSPSTEQFASEFAKLRQELKEDIERAVQSTKDRRIAKLETSLEEVAARLNVPPADVARAQRDIALDRLAERELRGEPLPAQDAGPSWEDEWQTGSEEILKAAEDFGVKIDRNDPELVAVTNGRYASKAAAFAAVTKLAARRSKRESTPVSAVAAEGTGTAPVSRDLGDLNEQLRQARLRQAQPEVIRDLMAKVREAMA